MSCWRLCLPLVGGRALKSFDDLGATVRSLATTAALLLVMMTIVIPIPAYLLDVGLAVSISIAMLILVMASLAEKPADFQAFPLMLLVSLVIRLALTVSSTRLILTDGNKGKEAAGKVISGFADFVAGGSLLIGLTVFGVITVVNFMVITKGSGRMAEVSARFALDSLPGKQLAIDGDLNSGAITHDEAKERRVSEQKEISFYGSLDGASKFVKGDAIAGLVITLINLLFGLSVGLLIHNMPISDALSTYSHLTIGDGLVTQIPALITSMAAALLLSRGGATERTSDLIFKQVFSSWQVSAVVGGGMVVLAAVPGLPSAIFLFTAIGLFAISFFVHQRDNANVNEGKVSEENVGETVRPARLGDLLDMDEISVEISASLIDSALDEVRGLRVRVNNLRNYIASSFGIVMPDVRITDGKEIRIDEYTIRLQGVVRGRGLLRPNSVLVLGRDEDLSELSGEKVDEPVYKTSGRWISRDQQDYAALSGLTVVTPMEVLSTHLLEVIKNNLTSLITMTGLQDLINELRSVSDEHRAEANQRFFDAMMPDKVAPELLLFVVRALLADKVSVRNLILITDAIHEARGLESPEKIYDSVRKRIRAQITDQYANDGGMLEILQLNPQWEAEMTRAEVELGKNNPSGLLQVQGRLSASIKKTLESLDGTHRAVLTVPDHRRRMVSSMLEAAGVGIAVMGLDEVDPAVAVRLVGTVAA